MASQEKYPEEHRRDGSYDFGCNPCSEIILRPDQFCNLTEVIVRPDDTEDTLKAKIEHAVFLGTLQSTLTDFKFLSGKWKTNCEEERLLGVSLTGILDHPFYGNVRRTVEEEVELEQSLRVLRQHSIDKNKKVAAALGINQSMAVTCVKPSGTVSQLCDTASGLHPRYAPYYIRRVRVDNKDPVCKFLIDQGVPSEVDKTNPHNTVFSFPCKAPDNAVVTKDLSAIDHLKLWEIYNDNWCEHKPSVTVSYHDHEYAGLMSYVWDSFDRLSGVSFLPHTESIYEQAPYEEITEEEYNKLKEDSPESIDWLELQKYETGDNTTVQPELACSAGVCEL